MNALVEPVPVAQRRSALASSSRADRDLLRARILLRAVVPALEVLTREQVSLGRPYRGVSATVHLGVAGHPELGVALCSSQGCLTVRSSHEVGESTQRWVFKDAAACNAFFLGRSNLPPIEGAWRHPFLLVKTLRQLRVLNVLRHLHRCPPMATERSVRVRAMLYLAGRAMVQMHKGGHPEMLSLVATSPERVYQWTVGNPQRSESISMYLRMAHGQIQMGHGIYRHREPFVHVAFRDVHAAFEILTGAQSAMKGIQGDLIQISGSPDYARKILCMMQRVEDLILDGSESLPGFRHEPRAHRA